MSGKGGDFERVISKFLSKWLTGEEKPFQYWRMPGSGGLATIHEENVGLSGDIRSLTPEAAFLTEHFSIECKTGYPKTTFWQHFKDIKNFNIKLFWKQCTDDADRAGKSPMLIYRKKGKKPIVGIDPKTMYFINDRLKDINFIMIGFNDGTRSLYLYDMEDFFNNITPDYIRRMISG